MKYMNDYDIALALQRNHNHPVQSRATHFLFQFKEEVDSHSDGWAYWAAPVRAAKKLMELVESNDATEEQLKTALSPIKSFYTRQGNQAGMIYPEVK
jgi:hypothetical protein